MNFEQLHIAQKKVFVGYFRLLTYGSVFLVLVTLISYPLQDRGTLSKILFQLGLSGENNIGSWWSGMLLLLGALHAFDGSLRDDATSSGRRGWLTLSLILTILSLDEISSFHEWVANTFGEIWWVPLGAFGATLFLYMIVNLWRSSLRHSQLALIALAFFMFASIVLQEHFQFAVTWHNNLTYGVRAAIEEGTEVAAMLILVNVSLSNTVNLAGTSSNAALGLSHRAPGGVVIFAVALLPIMVVASYVLPYPGGPADWLASALFLLGACAIFSIIIHNKFGGTTGDYYLLAVLTFASMLSNAVKLDYDPSLLGISVELRGIVLCLVLALVWIGLVMRGMKLPSTPLIFAILGLLLLSALTGLQWVWVTAPCLVAIWAYSAVLQCKNGSRTSMTRQRVESSPPQG
jgi:hypothetical protein